MATTTNDDNGSHNPAVPGVTGTPQLDTSSHHNATTNDETLAKGLACADPAAEAEVRANAVPFVTVESRKAKKKPSPVTTAENASMARVPRHIKHPQRSQANRAAPSQKRVGNLGRTAQGISAAAKATVVDKCLYQLRGFIEQQSTAITVMEQVKRIQQLETTAGRTLLSRTIAIDGNDENERMTLHSQLVQWIQTDHVTIQELRQRLRQVLLHYTPEPTVQPRMNWRAALTGATEPEEEPTQESDSDMQVDEQQQRNGSGGGVGRELPAGATPPPVPPQVQPRQLRDLTQLEWDDLRARCDGDYETEAPPSYLRAALPVAEYAAVLDGYEATVRGRLIAVLLPNMKVDDDATHFAILRQMRVGDELQSLKETATAFRRIAMSATYRAEARTLHFKVIGKPSAAAWHGRQIPFQGRLLTLVDVSGGTLAKTTYTFTLYNPTGTVTALEVMDALQHDLRLLVVDFDQVIVPNDEHNATDPGQWRATIQAPGCPEVLRDITVLLFGQRKVWIHHTEEHASHPCRHCYAPTHIDKACIAAAPTRTQHGRRVGGSGLSASGMDLAKGQQEPVLAWLQRVRTATQLGTDGDEEQHLGERMRDVQRLSNGRGPLVSLRQAQLMANGWMQLHAEWAEYVQTTEYQDRWAQFRLPALTAPEEALDSDDRLERLRKAHRRCDLACRDLPVAQTLPREERVMQPLSQPRPTPMARVTQYEVPQQEAASAPEVTREISLLPTTETATPIETPGAGTGCHAPEGTDPADDYHMGERSPSSKSTGQKGAVMTGPTTRGTGAKPTSRRGRTKSPRATAIERPSRMRKPGATARRNPTRGQPELLDLTSSPDVQMTADDGETSEAEAKAPATADCDMTCAHGAEPQAARLPHLHRAPRRLTETRAALLAMRGRPPAYGAGTYRPVEGHPTIKHLLTDLMASVCPTPPNGNCMSTALLESAVNRSCKTMVQEEQRTLEAAMRELKRDIYEAFDEDGEREAARMHHGNSIHWMENTGCTREEAHNRYFARLRDSDCHAAATVPVSAWGGIEALRMAAKASGTPIYLIVENAATGDCALFKIMQFRPGTEAEHWQELQLPYEAWWQHLSRESTTTGEWPPVLHHMDDHYSAVLIEGPPPTTLQPTLRDYFPTAADPVDPAPPTAVVLADRDDAACDLAQPSQTQPRGADQDSDVTTSQDEARSDYDQSATDHHLLVLRDRLRAASVDREEEVNTFAADPELTPLTPGQRRELDAYMSSLTDDDINAQARRGGGTSMAAARHHLWKTQRLAITGLATSAASLALGDGDADSTYAPSEDHEDPTDSDDSGPPASDAYSDDFEPTRALVQVVEGYFGNFGGCSLETHLAKPAVVAKLLKNISAWTAFFCTLPLAVEHVRDLPERFVRRWGAGALADMRLSLLYTTIDQLPTGPQRTALQTWHDGVTSRTDKRYAARLLGNTAKHRLLIEARPVKDRAWIQYLYEERWDWVVGIVVVACAVGTNSMTIAAPAAVDIVADCLRLFDDDQTARSTLEVAMAKRQVGQAVELVLSAMRAMRPRPTRSMSGATARAVRPLTHRN